MNSEAAAYFSNALANTTDTQIPASASSLGTVHSTSESARLIAISSPLHESSDEDLLLQVSKGSKEALSVLFRRHGHPVFNVAKRILRDDSEAEDLLQDLFLFLFQKAQLFDAKKGSAASWIIQMTYHRAIDRRRYLDFRQHYNTEELDEERMKGMGARVSVDEVAGRMLLDRLREHLSAEQRQTLELHFFEGYTFREIADRTGQTFGNVRNHYYRGLDRLRSYVFPKKTSLK
jgi:RNA polymerase sigma-70 factor (ECF subfamily)